MKGEFYKFYIFNHQNANVKYIDTNILYLSQQMAIFDCNASIKMMTLMIVH